MSRSPPDVQDDPTPWHLGTPSSVSKMAVTSLTAGVGLLVGEVVGEDDGLLLGEVVGAPCGVGF